MAQDYAASIHGTHIRVTALNPDGTLKTGANASYQTTSFISFSLTPEYEEGDEFTQKDAAGRVCVTYRGPDTLKRVNLSIALCNPDPEFTALIAGGQLLEEGGEVVGLASPKVGEDSTPDGVAIEVWSRAVVDGKSAGAAPYFHWIFPYARMRESGEKVIQNDIMGTEFEGWGVGNIGFADGPAAPFWPFPEATDRAYARTRSVTAPTGGTGWVDLTATTTTTTV